MLGERKAGEFLRKLGVESFDGEKWLDIARRFGDWVVPNDLLPPEMREKSLPYKLGSTAASAHKLGERAASRAVTIRDVVFGHDDTEEK